MQRAPSGGIASAMDIVDDPQFSLQPMAAAGRGYIYEKPLLCLFPRCESKFADPIALNHHQQQKHVIGLIPDNTLPGTLGEVSLPRAWAENKRVLGRDGSSLVDAAEISADSQAWYTRLNVQGMTMSQQEDSGHTTSLHDGLQLAYQSPSTFAFAGRNHTVHSVTNTQDHLSQRPQMGITTPQGPSVQYNTNQVQALIQQNAHHVNPSIVPARRHRCQYPGCNTTVARYSDLNRHMRTHQAGVKGFDCPDAGCDRKGVNGFPRKDKMMDHYNAVHQ